MRLSLQVGIINLKFLGESAPVVKESLPDNAEIVREFSIENSSQVSS